MLNNKGFSLIELALIMAVLAILISGGLSAGIGVTDERRREETTQKLDTIEAALQNFVTGRSRLPCPANITFDVSNVNFGRENIAGTVRNITGCTAVANQIFSVAVGANTIYGSMVPVRTLGLPDDYAFDGWGRRIFYAVNGRATTWSTTAIAPAAPAVSNTTPAFGGTGYVPGGAMAGANVDGGITVDVADGDRTIDTWRICATGTTACTTNVGAVYVVFSAGRDGHGAWNRRGSARTNAAVTNVDTLKNCHCTSTAANGAFDNIFIQDDVVVTNASSPDATRFDDLLRYKAPWQLR